MFVFQNVFGKKKTGTESGRQNTEDEAFVILGSTASDKTTVKDTDVNPNDMPPPFQMFQNLTVNDKGDLRNYPISGATSAKSATDDSAVNTMSIQDVPFALNSNLNYPESMDQLWHEITRCISSIVDPSSLCVEYDFSLEKAIISETAEK